MCCGSTSKPMVVEKPKVVIIVRCPRCRSAMTSDGPSSFRCSICGTKRAN